MARRRGQLVSDTTETTAVTAASSEGSSDEVVAQDLLARARREGVSLVGPGGLLAGLTKTVLETALEAELTDHLGYEKHDPVGRNGANSRNGTRSKQVITEVGPVEVDVPRDREGTFEPRIVPKRARRLGGVDELVISLVAKGLTTGEVLAHLAATGRSRTGRSTWPSASPWTANATSWACGPVRAARAPSTGCRSSPRSRTAAPKTSASWSATA